MYDYDKNAQYNHMYAAMQHIRNLCERRNMMISDEFSIEDYNIVSAEIRTACNMAKSFGCEIRLFQLDSFDVSPIIIIWVHNTCTGEVIKAAVRYVNEFGEIKSKRYWGDYHPYYIKREFNLPKGALK